jgi:hypothetical protein
MTRPNYCPNCGQSIKEDELNAVAIASTKGNRTGYDCYCPNCEWSGDIWPDDESDS